MGEIIKATTKVSKKWAKIWCMCLLAVILVVTSMGGSFLVVSNVYADKLGNSNGESNPQGTQGVLISGIEKIVTGNDCDVYMISYSNGLSTTFEVKHGNNGKDGETPVIGENGNWWIDGIDTGVLADVAINIPLIGINGNWWLGEKDTGFRAQGQNGQDGQDGQDGQTPYIGENGNWWIGDTDTEVSASGAMGTGITAITSLEKSSEKYQNYITDHDLNADLADVYEILYSDENLSYFHIVNGTDGINGDDGSDGADANRWLSGIQEPLEIWGNPGDFYLCTSTNLVYKKQYTDAFTNQYTGKLVEYIIDAETFNIMKNHPTAYGLVITETDITYANDITMTQISAMESLTDFGQSFYNYLWNYKLDGNGNANLYGYYGAEGALDIRGDSITRIHYEWKELTALNGTDGTNGSNGKSAYEVWRDYVDDEGNQPNLHKSIAEFFQTIKGTDGNSVQSIELVSEGDSSNDYVDTYKVTYSEQEPYYFTVRNGRDGLSAYQVWLQQNGYAVDDETRYEDFFASFAIDAISGLTILENGNWGIWKYGTYEDIPDDQKNNYVQGFDGAYYSDTGVQAKGETGATGKSAYEIYCEVFRRDPANDGQEPLNEYSWIQSLKGETGAAGKDAQLEISTDGYWVIGDVKTNYKVTGEKGEQGDTPYIDDNGYWCVGETNLGVLAKGPKGDKGDTGEAGISITGVNKISSDGVIDTYEISFSNGDSSTFVVTNGKDGADGTNGIDGKDGVDGKDGADIIMDFGIPTTLNKTGKHGDIYINLNNGEMYRYDAVDGWGAVVGTMRGTQWFTGTKTLEELNENPSGFNIDGFSVIKNDLYLNTSTYDIYKYNGIQWEQIGNLSGNKNEMLSEEYIRKIENSPYTRSGVKPGYFRSYNNPKKIVVIGNSITMHGPREADGIDWSVSDMREMAASRPDSGWVTLIKKYINDGLGLTDCKIYKGNGSTWEVAVNGSRSIDHILDQDTYEVLTTGVDLSTKGTFADVLTDDVDLILLQLSENMPAPTTDNDKMLTANDWANLYGSLQDLCPNAEIYQMTGFWPNLDKMQPLLSVAENPVFNPLLIPGCMTSYSDLVLKAQPGDNIYDADGEVIATVSQAVSGHPNDAGFLVIAEQFLDALFNDRSASNQSDYRLIATIANEETNVFNPYFEKEIFHRITSGGNVTEVDFGERHSYLDYFMLPGRYTITLTYPNKNGERHGVLEVERCSYMNGYNAVIQTILNSNQGTYRSITRNVQLHAYATVYNSWQFERQDFWITQTIDVSNVTITRNDWSDLNVYLYKTPTQIKEFYYIVTFPSSGDLAIDNHINDPRLYITSNNKVKIANWEDGDYTFPENTYLEIVYR